MPKIIKKYKLESQFGNEAEFEVTRIKKTEVKKTMRTDSDGYPISDRQNPVIETVTNYGITAISLPSRTPAKVIPIEVEDVSETQALISESALNTIEHNPQPPPPSTESYRPRPIRSDHILKNTEGPNGRPAAINLTKAMEGKNPSVTIVPKTGEVLWADNSDVQNISPTHPF